MLKKMYQEEFFDYKDLYNFVYDANTLLNTFFGMIGGVEDSSIGE
jgi:hypothetical protein